MNKRSILTIQLAMMIYSLSGIASKIASRYDFLSVGFIMCYGIEIMILGIYAIIWQQIIKHVEISIAYANKATTIFWSMIWSYTIFKEKLTINNIVGVFIIFTGILMVNKDV